MEPVVLDLSRRYRCEIVLTSIHIHTYMERQRNNCRYGSMHALVYIGIFPRFIF